MISILWNDKYNDFLLWWSVIFVKRLFYLECQRTIRLLKTLEGGRTCVKLNPNIVLAFLATKPEGLVKSSFVQYYFV